MLRPFLRLSRETCPFFDLVLKAVLQVDSRQATSKSDFFQLTLESIGSMLQIVFIVYQVHRNSYCDGGSLDRSSSTIEQSTTGFNRIYAVKKRSLRQILWEENL